MSKKYMWEVYVPVSSIDKKGRGFDWPDEYHREWDAKVRSISGGLTLFKPVKGQWVNRAGELIAEKVIPVRIACDKNGFKKILDITLKHYSQKQVLGFKFGEALIVKERR